MTEDKGSVELKETDVNERAERIKMIRNTLDELARNYSLDTTDIERKGTDEYALDFMNRASSLTPDERARLLAFYEERKTHYQQGEKDGRR